MWTIDPDAGKHKALTLVRSHLAWGPANGGPRNDHWWCSTVVSHWKPQPAEQNTCQHHSDIGTQQHLNSFMFLATCQFWVQYKFSFSSVFFFCLNRLLRELYVSLAVKYSSAVTNWAFKGEQVVYSGSTENNLCYDL